MLLEFRAENHRSLREEQILTMEAARFSDPNDPTYRAVDILDKRVLPAAAIYGANASGKSNVLSALGFLKDAVLDSHTSWPPQGGVPRDAFAWDGFAEKPSMFEVTIIVGDIRYQYGFTANQAQVLEEWLFAWPKGRRQTWFEREGNVFNFGDKLKGENRLIEQVTRSNSLFLSTATQHQHPQLVPIYNWFRKIKTIRVLGYKERYLDAMPAAGLDKLRRLLATADMGITDIRVESENKQPKVLMRHESADGEGVWLPLEQESHGTQALFHLGPAVLEVLGDGGILVVDELETSLHPFIAMRLVNLFNHLDTNPKAAQIVFTTHDTSLLATTIGDGALRRDQIWLTEKDKSGATTLYPLTDYKPRKEENLERGYLQGRFGAIPFLGDMTGVME
jgi:predicted ATPase